MIVKVEKSEQEMKRIASQERALSKGGDQDGG